MKSPARLKERVQILMYKMFINEIDFHRLFGGIMNVVFSIFYGVLHGKSADFPAKNVKCKPVHIKQRDMPEG